MSDFKKKYLKYKSKYLISYYGDYFDSLILNECKEYNNNITDKDYPVYLAENENYGYLKFLKKENDKRKKYIKNKKYKCNKKILADKLFYNNGLIKYIGNLKSDDEGNNIPNGEGIMYYYKNNYIFKVYIGNFDNNFRDNDGRLINFETKEIYEGKWTHINNNNYKFEGKKIYNNYQYDKGGVYEFSSNDNNIKTIIEPDETGFISNKPF